MHNYIVSRRDSLYRSRSRYGLFLPGGPPGSSSGPFPRGKAPFQPYTLRPHKHSHRWLPLSEAVLGMVVSCLPGPQEAQADRLPRLLPKRLVRARAPAELLEEIARIDRAVEGCEAGPDTPCMVFVSKVRAGAEDTAF